MDYDIIVAGGGAAGFFAALRAAEANPHAAVALLEQSPRVLTKVSISGGGRCNVTHECYDPHELIKAYPRGAVELLGPFHKWQPGDTMTWFEDRGVPLKVESDGRVFPQSDSSQSIVDCLTHEAERIGVTILLRTGVDHVLPLQGGGFIVTLADGSTRRCRCLLLATGGNQGNRAHRIATELGHTVIDPVPSLFTFIIPDSRLKGLPGLSVATAGVSVAEAGLSEQGPVLITHWGLSGPAILRLSAWGARQLRELDYKFSLTINWCDHLSPSDFSVAVADAQRGHPRKRVAGFPLAGIPARLWERLVIEGGIGPDTTWHTLERKQISDLANCICRATFAVDGRSRNKEEFVTCGGIALPEVDFRTMESRVVPGLFFAGETLNIDAITGGYNFQAAWTTGHLAGSAMAATVADSLPG